MAATHTHHRFERVPKRNILIVTISLGILLNPLNSSMISVALARIQQDFHLTFTTSSWLISSYYLTSAISQPVMGKIADVFGRKRVFITGLLLVALSSMTAPYSPTFGWLITLRLIQSLGSGALYPAGMGIVRHWITERQAQALALLSVFASGAAAFGPSLGGIVMHWGDWQAIFWVNIPFIIASVSMALWFLPRDATSVESRTDTADSTEGSGAVVKKESLFGMVVRRLDLLGIGVFAGAIVASLVFLLTMTDNLHPLVGVLAVLLITVFIWWETRSKLPFIDLRMLTKNMSLTWVLIQFVTVNIIFYSIFFGIPTYLQDVRHFNPQDTGFIMLAVAGFSVIISPLTGRWVERSGSRPPLLLAGLCLTVGSALFVTVHTQSPVWWLVIILSTLGLSNGFNNVGLQTALFRVSPQEVISTASGLFQMSRYLGTILSTVLLGLMFGNRLSTLELRHLGIVLAVFGVLVIWMSWRLPKKA